MDKTEIRYVIKFLHLQGKAAKRIYDELFAVYKEECPSYDTVKRWKKHFEEGNDSVQDEPRKGRPSIADDESNIARVEALVLSDNQITVEQIAAESGLSHGTILKILHEHLNMSKVCTEWVPSLLAPFQEGRQEEHKAQRG